MKDTTNIEIYGFLKIKDTETGRIILNKKTEQPLKEIKENGRLFKSKSNRLTNHKE
jgi:hypothetical protein